MSYLVRKISSYSQYYKISQTENIHDVEADVMSCDLRTTKNCLSTWAITDPTEVDSAILAIASTSDHIEKMTFLILDETNIIANELEVVEETADCCPVSDLASAHVNISNLSYKKIGAVLSVLKDVPDSSVITRTKQQILTLISDAKNSGRLNVLLLKKDVMKYISPPDHARIFTKE